MKNKFFWLSAVSFSMNCEILMKERIPKHQIELFGNHFVHQEKRWSEFFLVVFLSYAFPEKDHCIQLLLLQTSGHLLNGSVLPGKLIPGHQAGINSKFSAPKGKMCILETHWWKIQPKIFYEFWYRKISLCFLMRIQNENSSIMKVRLIN